VKMLRGTTGGRSSLLIPLVYRKEPLLESKRK
jgi:hypothetical protein